MNHIQIELHCHSIFSKDSLVTPKSLLRTCREKKIAKVAITDHNSIRGATQAKMLDPDRVIIGEEIMTTQGEILAFFVQKEIPAFLDPLEVIDRLRQQGAYISVSHPFDNFRKGSWLLPELEAIAPLVDAIEVFNARCYQEEANQNAVEFAKKWNLGGTGGADAHTNAELGQAKMYLPDFSTRDEFAKSVRSAHIEGVRSSGLVHLSSRWAVWLKSIGLVKHS